MIVERLNTAIIQQFNLEVSMARADQIHPLASGNKYYKLKPSLEYAKDNNIKCLLSFGGAFSNHIHALALTAQKAGFDTIGIIRGEAQYADNPTLRAARNAGMKLVFVSREEYRQRANQAYIENLQNEYPSCLIIPEGGSNNLAIKGCINLAKDINTSNNNADFDVLAVASGTGATAAGLICGAKGTQSVQVYSALKDASLENRIKRFIKPCANQTYQIHQADYGGFAKISQPLLEFVWDWYEDTGILLDPIYTSKLIMRLIEQVKVGFFSPGTRICVLHSGGLQGWLGMEQRVVKLMGHSYWQKLERILANTL